MAANTAPVFTLTADLSSNNGTGFAPVITLGAGDYTGISANYVLVHTAGANGSYIRRLRIKGVSTNTAGVLRVFINNGAVNTTATNNTFYDEVNLPVTTASTIAATPATDLPMEIALAPGEKLYVGLGVAAFAGGGWNVTTIAGQY